MSEWCIVRGNYGVYYKYPSRNLPVHADNIIKKDLTREEASRWIRLLMGNKG